MNLTSEKYLVIYNYFKTHPKSTKVIYFDYMYKRSLDGGLLASYLFGPVKYEPVYIVDNLGREPHPVELY